MAKHNVTIRVEGETQNIEGDSLEALQTELARLEYDGGKREVHDDHGSLAGWVSATDWRHA